MIKRSPGPQWEALHEPTPSSSTSEDELDMDPSPDDSFSLALKRKTGITLPQSTAKRSRVNDGRGDSIALITGNRLNDPDNPSNLSNHRSESVLSSRFISDDSTVAGPSTQHGKIQEYSGAEKNISGVPRKSLSNFRERGASAARTKIVRKKQKYSEYSEEDEVTSPPASTSPPPQSASGKVTGVLESSGADGPLDGREDQLYDYSDSRMRPVGGETLSKLARSRRSMPNLNNAISITSSDEDKTASSSKPPYSKLPRSGMSLPIDVLEISSGEDIPKAKGASGVKANSPPSLIRLNKKPTRPSLKGRHALPAREIIVIDDSDDEPPAGLSGRSAPSPAKQTTITFPLIPSPPLPGPSRPVLRLPASQISGAGQKSQVTPDQTLEDSRSTLQAAATHESTREKTIRYITNTTRATHSLAISAEPREPVGPRPVSISMRAIERLQPAEGDDIMMDNNDITKDSTLESPALEVFQSRLLERARHSPGPSREVTVTEIEPIPSGSGSSKLSIPVLDPVRKQSLKPPSHKLLPLKSSVSRSDINPELNSPISQKPQSTDSISHESSSSSSDIIRSRNDAVSEKAKAPLSSFPSSVALDITPRVSTSKRPPAPPKGKPYSLSTPNIKEVGPPRNPDRRTASVTHPRTQRHAPSEPVQTLAEAITQAGQFNTKPMPSRGTSKSDAIDLTGDDSDGVRPGRKTAVNLHSGAESPLLESEKQQGVAAQSVTSSTPSRFPLPKREINTPRKPVPLVDMDTPHAVQGGDAESIVMKAELKTPTRPLTLPTPSPSYTVSGRPAPPRFSLSTASDSSGRHPLSTTTYGPPLPPSPISLHDGYLTDTSTTVVPPSEVAVKVIENLRPSTIEDPNESERNKLEMSPKRLEGAAPVDQETVYNSIVEGDNSKAGEREYAYILEYVEEATSRPIRVTDTDSDSEMKVEDLLAATTPVSDDGQITASSTDLSRVPVPISEDRDIHFASPDPLDMSSTDSPHHIQSPSRRSSMSSNDPMDILEDEAFTTPPESFRPTPDDPLVPVTPRIYGGFQSLNWQTYRRNLDNFTQKCYLARDLPHSLQDHINRWSETARHYPALQDVLQIFIHENSHDEPDAPLIEIINTVDHEPTPPWEFHYTNQMWHGEGVPPPDVTRLSSCGCRGKCNPKSQSCACSRRQQQYTSEITPDFVYDAKGRLRTFDYPIFECNVLCGCDDECRNRVVQHGRKCAIRIQKTLEKGWGVFAGPKKIIKGTFVGIYSGELLRDEVGEKRGEKYNISGRTYLFDLDFHHLKEGNPNWEIQYTVDAYHAGNFTRFLNHSCDPNCQLVPCYINDSNMDKPLLAVFTRRDVEAFEELCFSYSGQYPDDDEDDNDDHGNSVAANRRMDQAVYAKCACGASNCTGIMFT